MRIRPLRHCQVRIRPYAAAPDTQDVLGAIKAEIKALGQLAIVQALISIPITSFIQARRGGLPGR